MKKYIPYIIADLIFFYLMPFAVASIPVISQSGNIVRMINFIITVFILTIASMIYGRNNGFTLILPLLSLILFVPYGFIANFPPARIFFYMIFYFIVTIIGIALGMMFKKHDRKIRKAK